MTVKWVSIPWFGRWVWGLLWSKWLSNIPWHTGDKIPWEIKRSRWQPFLFEVWVLACLLGVDMVFPTKSWKGTRHDSSVDCVQLILAVCRNNLAPSLFVTLAVSPFRLSKLILELCCGDNGWAIMYKHKKTRILMLQVSGTAEAPPETEAKWRCLQLRRTFCIVRLCCGHKAMTVETMEPAGRDHGITARLLEVGLATSDRVSIPFP